MTKLTYVVGAVALLLSLVVLTASGLVAMAAVSGGAGGAEWGLAAVALGLGLAQAAAPSWLLWRTAKGKVGGWGAAVGAVCLVVSVGLGVVMVGAVYASAQP